MSAFPTLAQRLTATIDLVNAQLLQNTLLPCKIESIGIYEDGRLAEVRIRYENGQAFGISVAADYLNPMTLMEAVHRSFLFQWCALDLPDEHDPEFDVVGFATGKAPVQPQTHRDATHHGPEKAQ